MCHKKFDVAIDESQPNSIQIVLTGPSKRYGGESKTFMGWFEKYGKYTTGNCVNTARGSSIEFVISLLRADIIISFQNDFSRWDDEKQTFVDFEPARYVFEFGGEQTEDALEFYYHAKELKYPVY